MESWNYSYTVIPTQFTVCYMSSRKKTMESLPELIAKYKLGDSDSAERILIRLLPLEEKYFRVIKSGYGSFSDGVDYFLASLKHPEGAGRGLLWLMDRAKRYSDDEIRQEIKISILECSYEKPYFYGYFTTILARNIKELFGPFDNHIPLEEDYVEDKEDIPEKINYLTDEEENILRVYVDTDMNVNETAERLGSHIRTIYRRLRTIQDKIYKVRNNASNKN